MEFYLNGEKRNYEGDPNLNLMDYQYLAYHHPDLFLVLIYFLHLSLMIVYPY